jgi:tetratricopeptide (TPR) repeat protein
MRSYTDPRQSLAYLDEALRAFAVLQDVAALAFVRCHRGLIQCFDGDTVAGIAAMADGVTAVAACGDAARERLRERTSRLHADDADAFEGTLALWLSHTGRFAEARACGERFLARRSISGEVHVQDASGEGDAYNGLGRTYAATGLPEQARRAFAQARAAHLAVGHYVHVGGCAIADLWWVVLPYYTDQRAEWTRLAQLAADALIRAESSGIPGIHPRLPYLAPLFVEGGWTEVNAVAGAVRTAEGERESTSLYVTYIRPLLGMLAVAQGDTPRAWRLVREALVAGPQPAPEGHLLLSTLPLQRLAAELALDGGDPATAKEWLDAHDRWLAWSGAALGRSEGQALWARYHRLRGDANAAHDAAERALAHATDPR